MTFWNLIVVLCFLVLYLGVVLVFAQLRRLREEIHQRNGQQQQGERDFEVLASTLTENMQRELASWGDHLVTRMEKISQQIQGDLDAVRADMRFRDRSSSGGMSKTIQESDLTVEKEDAYREARLLLSNGVDEERVINETGLTVEEVSLLKRIAHQQQGET